MTAARLARLGLRLGPLGTPTLVASFAPPRPRVGALVLIPHGRTPSNQRLIFQDHSEGPDATLLPESLVEAGKGAEVFLDAFGDRLERCSFRRSPLHRCAQTWGVYETAFAGRGLEVPEIAVDGALVEINHASWHGKTVEELEGADRAAAAAHRAGDVLAKPPDGESQLDVLERAAVACVFKVPSTPFSRGRHSLVGVHTGLQGHAHGRRRRRDERLRRGLGRGHGLGAS